MKKETKTTTKLRQIGGSAGVILDAKVRYKAEIEIGDEFDISAQKEKIVLTKINKGDAEKWDFGIIQF